MTAHQAWGYGLAGPVQRRPILWLTLGAITAGFGLGAAIGWRRGR